MIRLSGIDGFDYEKFPSYDDLISWMQSSSILNDTRVEWHDLGVSSDPTKNIYGISVGDTSQKPVIFIQHQIHGRHEWRCSHWGFKWIEKLLNHDLGNPQLTRQLLSTFSFYVIPCLNPYGYENSTYGNANNVNLNRNYDFNWEENTDTGYGTSKGSAPFSEPEAIISRDLVLSLKPFLFLDTHTRGENVIGSMFTGSSKFLFPFADEIATSYRLSVGQGIANYPTLVNRPDAASWAGSQTNNEGTSIMSFTAEAPHLATEKEQSRLGFYLLTMFSVYAMRYKENRMLRQYN